MANRLKSSVSEESDVKSFTSSPDAVIDWTPEEEKEVIRKIDRRILPILAICYMLQLLDKNSLSAASLLGIFKDLHLSDGEYGWATAIFWFGYLFFTYPTSVLLVKFPVGKFVSASVASWAALVMLHAACFNAGGLLTVRIFLGVAEATCTPAFALLIGLFYKRSEQSSRQNLWFLGQAVGGTFAALISWSSTFIHAAIPSWKLLFIIFGAATIVWACVMWFFLPNHPTKANFLSVREREIASARLATNANKGSTKYDKNEMIAAFMDPQVWLLTLHTFAVQLGAGGFGAFSLIVLSGLGFDDRTTLLLNMPVAAFQLLFITVGIVGARYKNTSLYTMMFNITWSLIGMTMVFAIDDKAPWSKYGGYCLTTAYVANMPLALSLVTSNVVGHTKQSTAMFIVFVGFCVGNIVGPKFYIQSERPNYPTGLGSAVAGFAVGLVLLVALRVYYMWQNRKNGVAAEDEYVNLHMGSMAHEPLAGSHNGRADQGNEKFAYIM